MYIATNKLAMANISQLRTMKLCMYDKIMLRNKHLASVITMFKLKRPLIAMKFLTPILLQTKANIDVQLFFLYIGL